MATTQELETLVVKLIGDDSKYRSMLKRVNKETKETGTKVEKSWKKTMTSMSNSMVEVGATMTAAVAVPVGMMIREFAGFDDAMTKSTAIMGEMSAEMRAEMEETARVLSLNTVTSATAAAEAYFFLASAGMDAEQAISALPVVEKFATSGAFDMATATDLLTDAQSALGLSTKNAAENMMNMTIVSDTLVKANTLANASVQQFSEALTNEAGAAIKQYNMDLTEGVALLATYADQGLKGNVAGSMMARMTRLLIKSVNDNGSAFRDLNIDVGEFASTGKNITGVIGGISKAVEGMGPAQKAATLETLGFQARIQQAILPLLGMTDKIRDYEKSLGSAAGITEEVAEKQLKSFTSQMKILWNQIKDVGITIGAALAPALSLLSEVLKGVLAVWRAFPSILQTSIGYLVGLGAVLATLTLGLGLFSKALVVAWGALTTLQSTIASGSGATMALGMYSKVVGIATVATTKLKTAVLSFAASSAAVGKVKTVLSGLLPIVGKLGISMKLLSVGSLGLMGAVAYGGFKLGELLAHQIWGAKDNTKELKEIQKEVAQMEKDRPKYAADTITGYDETIARATKLVDTISEETKVYRDIENIQKKIAAAEQDIIWARQEGDTDIEKSRIEDIKKINVLLAKQKKTLLEITSVRTASEKEKMETDQLKQVDLTQFKTLADVDAEIARIAESNLTDRQRMTAEIEKQVEFQRKILKLGEVTGGNQVAADYAATVQEKIVRLEKDLLDYDKERTAETKKQNDLIEKRAKRLKDSAAKEAEKAMRPYTTFAKRLADQFATPAEELQKKMVMLQKTYASGALGTGADEKFMKYAKGLTDEFKSPEKADESGFGNTEQKEATILSKNMSLASLTRGRQDLGGQKAQLDEAKKSNQILNKQLTEAQEMKKEMKETKEAVKNTKTGVGLA